MTREEVISVLEESKRQNEIILDNPNTFFKASDIVTGEKNAQKRIDALNMAIYALRQQDVTDKDVGKWISVKDRMPEPGVNVLARCFYHERWQMFVCYVSKRNLGNWYTGVAGQWAQVTHWMPLPEPPEEGTV